MEESTTPERLSQIEELFHSAREREPGERAAFLAEACQEDNELRREVESLLASAPSSSCFLEKPVIRQGAETLASQQSHSEHEFAPGLELGPYLIEARLGAGGMGEVYRAKDKRLHRTVALKVLLPYLARSPGLRQRLEREAEVISSLNHPHICTLYDIGRQGEVDYLVMEFLEGETLAARLARKPLTLDETLRIAVDVADALDAAHRQGVIHRDLKPGNIMLTKSGAKLMDFGLAKVKAAKAGSGMTAGPTQTTPLTGEGTILGTLQYMAPEQLDGKEADGRTDIFALGAMIYEMATGRKAFEGKSQASLISAIMTSEPLTVSTLQSMAPPLLNHVVKTCLAKDPGGRWQAAHDVLVQLKWIADAGSQAVMPAPVVARRRRRELLLSLLLASASIALLVGTLAHFRQKPQEMQPIRFSISSPEKVTFADFDLAGPVLVSPDGSRLAFVGVDNAGKSQLWVRPLDAVAAQPLPGTANAHYPFWSPDSRQLAFFAGGKLKKVTGGGEPPQTLCDAPNGRGGSWAASKDGGPGIIVFARDFAVGLSWVSAAGGEPVQVTALDPSRQESSHRQPEFLPDGRHFLFVAISPQTDNNNTYIGDIQATPDPKNVRRLMGGAAHVSYAPPGYLLFPRDTSLMAQAFDARRLEFTGDAFVLADHVATGVSTNTSDFSVSTNGVLAWRTQSDGARQLAWFDRNGKQIKGLDARERYLYPILSPDGHRVAVNTWDPALPGILNIWLLDLVRGSASRFTFGAGSQWPGIWSPDGRRIVFGVDRDYGLYWKDSSGAGPEELLLKTAQLSLPRDWSRDGRFILFTQYDRKTKLWVLPLAGDRKPVRVLQTEFNENLGAFSPDSHWIAYCSDETGRTEVYVRSFTEGGAAITAGKWQVSTAGGFTPRWRQDGKELFFHAPDGKLMAVPVKSSSTFDPEVPVALFDTHDPHCSYEVSPDGRRFLISRVFEGDAVRPVNVCTNWLAGMKK